MHYRVITLKITQRIGRAIQQITLQWRQVHLWPTENRDKEKLKWQSFHKTSGTKALRVVIPSTRHWLVHQGLLELMASFSMLDCISSPSQATCLWICPRFVGYWRAEKKTECCWGGLGNITEAAGATEIIIRVGKPSSVHCESNKYVILSVGS